MRTPDGRITVKGLLPGQQLVQYPDGKLHVLTSAQLQTGLTPVKGQATPTTAVKAAVKQAIQQTSAGSLVFYVDRFIYCVHGVAFVPLFHPLMWCVSACSQE